MKLKIYLEGTWVTVRWGLDTDSYIKIAKIVKRNYFDSLAKEYYYELVPQIGIYKESPIKEKIFLGCLRCVQQTKAKRIEFECSEHFAGNIEWFKKDVKKLKDVEHLAWEKFQ
ncbi:hypothetical protein [Sutcliffiella rhizosphaerae]|nr:hypothetical protein [Sutcliffiella rhizosphaerae]